VLNLKKPVTIRIDEEVLDKVRDIVYYNRDVTLNEFCAKAIGDAVIFYDQFDGIPKRPCANLRSGRKIS